MCTFGNGLLHSDTKVQRFAAGVSTRITMRAALCGSGTTCVRAERGARLVALRGLRQVCPVKIANLQYVVWRALYCLEKPSMVPSRRRTSLDDLGTEQLAALAAVTGKTAELPRMQELFTELLEVARARRELAGAYPARVREACPRGFALDELVYFSLDLVAQARARVKVYFRHHHARAGDLERVIGGRGGVRPGEVTAFCETVLGHAGPYDARPIVSCWAFCGGTAPPGAPLYAPIAYYVRDDAEAQARVQRWLAGQQLAVEPYERCLAAFARRPLDQGSGMTSYVSFKRDAGRTKLTCYLAPEAYRTFAPGELADRKFPPPRRPALATDLVHWLEPVERCTDHPLFRRLAREQAAVAPLWTILANNWVAVGDRFPRWLAGLVARVEDDRVRSVLAKQLDDELGHGDPTRAHRVLFQRMLADLEPYAPAGDRQALLAPGRRFAEGLAHNYLAKPELEAIGGTLVAEVYGKQVDQAIGNLLRRQHELDPASLTWLVLHETLEEDHADESLELAAMMPADRATQAAVCRGAEALAQLGMRYFDDIYKVMFG